MKLFRTSHVSFGNKHDLLWAALFLLPGILLLTILILLPAFGTVITSFRRDITFLDNQWAGIQNYIELFNNPSFIQSFRFTILFIIVSVPLELLFGTGLALLMNFDSPYRGIIRATVLIPWAIPAVISGRIWELIYNVNYGLANHLFGLFGFSPINWLGSSAGAFWAIVVADLWKTIPFVAIILLAGLTTIPESIYKQAQIDGASFVRIFYSITLPMIRPVIVVALLFRTIDALRIFDLIFVLTGGGPGGSTASLSHLGYHYFVGGDFGYGSALSVIIFVCALILSLIVIRVGKFTQETL